MKAIKYVKVFLTFTLTTLAIYLFGVLCNWDWSPANWNVFGRLTLGLIWFWKTLDYVEIIQDNLDRIHYSETED